MCGVVGFVGTNPAPFVMDGLRRLEYRGYDSWGVAFANEKGGMLIERGVGRVPSDRSDYFKRVCDDRTVGLGHVRWASHGRVNIVNAHPIAGGMREVGWEPRICPADTWVVHNGVISNHENLKRFLTNRGYVFETETDTEVIAHLLSCCAQNYSDVRHVIDEAVGYLGGQFAFIATSSRFPKTLILACCGSPLLISECQTMVASDPAAFAGYAKTCRRLEDGAFGVVTQGKVSLYDGSRAPIDFCELDMVDVPQLKEEASTGDHMLREIHEQADTVLVKPGYTFKKFVNSPLKELVLIGCGSSYNACLLGRGFFEQNCQRRTTVEYASEFSQRDVGLYPDDTTFVFVSQSGETKDVLSALDHLLESRPNAITVAFTNSPHSSLARRANEVFTLNVGPEYGVAATKTFTATVLGFLDLCRPSGGDRESLSVAISSLLDPAFDAEAALLAAGLNDYNRALFLGRGLHYATAREAALKVKEIAYLHAEAMPAAEMKHGPIALIDDQTASVFVVTGDGDNDKILANVQEIKAREGTVFVVTDEKGKVPGADFELIIPRVHPNYQPVVATVALQLVAYHLAKMRGLDVDRPRSLAKCVSV